MKTATKKLLASFLLLVIFVIACVRLGMWQWDRASEYGKKIPDLPRVELSAVAKPGQFLDPAAYGRLVSTSGSYVKAWMVNDRKVGDRTGTWQVALLKTSQGELLVVRSWDNAALPQGEVKVQGRLYPAQSPESSASSGQLVRVDPALVVNQSSGPLYDGYVVASSEEPATETEFVPSPQPQRNPPGYYWQHVSYVILWWFFGLLAILVWARSAREELKR